MSLRLAEQYNASLAGEVSPEQSVQTLQPELQQIIAQGQVVGYLNYYWDVTISDRSSSVGKQKTLQAGERRKGAPKPSNLELVDSRFRIIPRDHAEIYVELSMGLIAACTDPLLSQVL